MSKNLIKAILSPVVLVLISIMAMFGASAEVTEKTTPVLVGKVSSETDRISTLDEKNIEATDSKLIPTMKPAYYNSPNNTKDEASTDSQVTEKTDNTSYTQSVTDEQQPPAPDSTGATSKVSTYDTPQETTPTTVKSGVVQTSDSPQAVMILVGLIALTCLLIGIHKKNIVE